MFFSSVNLQRSPNTRFPKNKRKKIEFVSKIKKKYIHYYYVNVCKSSSTYKEIDICEYVFFLH